MIIGITGSNGAGKGSVVSYLTSRYQFTHYSSRALISEYVRAAGLPETRDQLRLMANQLRAERGDDVVVALALESIAAQNTEWAVIESIRTMAEAQLLKKEGAYLINVDAHVRTRYERITRRGSATDHVSFETFVSQEEIENHDPDPHGMQKTQVATLADVTFLNNGSLRALHAEIDAWINPLLKL